MRAFTKIATLCLLIVFIQSISIADVPPELGSKRVSVNLIVEAADEFPGHRFFVKSGSDLKEVSLKKAERITIGPMGGGAWYRVGSLLAVPNESLAGLNEGQSEGKLSQLQQAVYDGKAVGTIELINHIFVRDVPQARASRVTDAVFRIEKDAETGIRAVLVSGGANDINADPGPGFGIYSREAKSPMFWASVIGASLLSLALISLGVWTIRRSKARAS